MLIALVLQAAAAIQPTATGAPPATMVVDPVAMAIVACDGNGDGATTAEELATFVGKSFAATSGSGGGSVGYLGFADWAERWLGDRNALPSPFEIDSDGDNRITQGELQAGLARVFARLDRDRDGRVTRKEALTIRAGDGGDHVAPGRGRRQR